MMTPTKWLIGAGVLAVIAAAGLYPWAAKAADLGGNCCTDLEERIAELEATTARKGNRKLTLTISGQVNKALLYVHTDGDNTHGVVDNPNSPSRLRFEGKAKLDKDWEAGFLIELGVGSPEDSTVASGGLTGAIGPAVGISGLGEVYVRHNAVWVGSPVGRIYLGHTSTATDAIVEIDLSNIKAAQLPTASWMGFDGGRAQVVKYVSPALAGFEVSASLMDSLLTDKTPWDAALRYAGEFGGFRLAAGVGYADNGSGVTRASGSASLMHSLSGIFATVQAGKFDGGSKTLGLQAGWEKNFTGIGATTFFGELSKSQDGAFAIAPLGFGGAFDDLQVIGFGAVQKVDALALDLYATYRQFDPGSGAAKVDMFLLGTRVSF